jgi:hypothetical protein
MVKHLNSFVSIQLSLSVSLSNLSFSIHTQGRLARGLIRLLELVNSRPRLKLLMLTRSVLLQHSQKPLFSGSNRLKGDFPRCPGGEFPPTQPPFLPQVPPGQTFRFRYRITASHGSMPALPYF